MIYPKPDSIYLRGTTLEATRVASEFLDLGPGG